MRGNMWFPKISQFQKIHHEQQTSSPSSDLNTSSREEMNSQRSKLLSLRANGKIDFTGKRFLFTGHFMSDNFPNRYHYGPTTHRQELVSIVAIFIHRISGDTSKPPLLITVGKDNLEDKTVGIKVWELFSMKYLAIFSKHTKEDKKKSITTLTTAVATHELYPYVVSGDDQGFVYVWDPRSYSLNLDENPEDISFSFARQFQEVKILSICIVAENQDNLLRGGGDHELNILNNIAIVLAMSDKTVSVLDGELENCYWKFKTDHTDLLLSVTAIYCDKGLQHGHHNHDATKVRKALPVAERVENQTSVESKGKSDVQSQSVCNAPNTDIVMPRWYRNFSILTSSWDKSIRCWHISHKKDNDGITCCGVLRGHTKCVTSVVSCYIYDQASKLQEHDGDNSMKHRQPMPLLISGSLDKTCIIWDLEKFEKIHVLSGHEDKITIVRVVCDDVNQQATRVISRPLVITASEDKHVIMWDLLTGTNLRNFRHLEKVVSMDAHLFKEGLLIVAGEDPGARKESVVIKRKHSLHVWNLLQTKRWQKVVTKADVIAIATISNKSKVEPISSSEISPWLDKTNPNPVMIIGCIDGGCRSFSIKSGTAVADKMVNSGNKNTRVNALLIYEPPASVAKVPPLLIISEGDANLSVWDLFGGKKLITLEGHSITLFAMCIYEPRSDLTLEQDDKVPLDRHLLISGAFDKKICVWDMDGMFELIRKMAIVPEKPLTMKPIQMKPNAHLGPIRCMSLQSNSLSRERPTFVTGSYDRTAILWDLAALKELRIFENVHNGFVFGSVIYDPLAHCGSQGNRKLPEKSRKDPILATGGYDGVLVLYNLKTNGRPYSTNVETDLDNRDDEDCFVTNFLIDYEESNIDKEKKSSKMPAKKKCVETYLRKTIAHSDSITALALYSPKLPKDDPLIITGCIDTKISIWNLITGECLQTLVAHTNRVCYLAVLVLPSYENSHEDDRKDDPEVDRKDDKGLPVLLSGADDQSVIIWRDTLHQRSYMPTCDLVCEMFYADLTSMSNDDDNARSITAAQKSDKKNSEESKTKLNKDHPDWKLITNLVQTFEHEVFTENPYLFSLAVEVERPDFLLKFFSYLTFQIRFLPDLLQEAIDKNDLISVRIVLLAWLESCNRDIDNRLDQRLFHASYFLPIKHLRSLAAMYPLEFVNFISGLSLVRNHHSLIGGHNKQKLHLIDRFNICGVDNPSDEYATSWRNHFEDRSTLHYHWNEVHEILLYERCSNAQSVTSLMVPLMNSASISILELFVEVSSLLNNVEIFRSQVGVMSLKHYWDSHGRWLHFSAMLKYIICLVVFMICIYSYQFQFQHQKHENTINSKIELNALNVIMIILFGYYLFEEIEQCSAKYNSIHKKLGSDIFVFKANSDNVIERYFPVKKDVVSSSTLKAENVSQTSAKVQSHPTQSIETPLIRVGAFVVSHFIFDIWNMVDMIVIITGIVGLSLRLAYAQDTPTGRVFLSITSILMWFKLLYFMRPFSSSGPLVAMIIQIAFSIRFFLIALFSVLAGFTQGFWLLSNMDEHADFGTVRKSLWASFMTMLGAMLPEFDGHENASPAFARFLMVIFMMVMIVLMLNILIALMGDAFSRVRDSGLALWRKEQATICIEEMFSSPMSSFARSISPYHRVDKPSKPSVACVFAGTSHRLTDQAITVKPFIHVLQYTSDVGANEPSKELRKMVEASIIQVHPFTPLSSSIQEKSQEK